MEDKEQSREKGSAVEEKFREQERKIDQYRKQVMRRYYEEQLRQAKDKNIPVAYMAGCSPLEIFFAMGILPCVPENYVTICTAKQMGQKFCEAAEGHGMSRDLCSHSRVGLGIMWLEEGPYGPLPQPDVIMAYPYICDPHAQWWQIAARHFNNVPLFILDGNFFFKNQKERHQLEWQVAQLQRFCSFLEEVTKRKFDYDRFKEVMKLSGEARRLYREISEYRKAIPCPRGLRETVGDLFYLNTQMGTKEAVEYFTMVRDLVKGRVKHKVGIVPNEKFRLIWDNIVIWYKLQLIDYFAERGAVFTIDTYPTTMWEGYYFSGGTVDPERPFESLAEIQLTRFIYRSLNLQMEWLERMVREWHCDGAVFFSNRGCQTFSRGVPEKERLFRERTGALTMSFEAEMADPRSMHEAEVLSRVDSFLETLEQRKSQR